MRVSTGSLDHGYGVCGAHAERNWVEGRSDSLHVFHWLPESERHCSPHSSVAGTLTHRRVPPRVIAIIQKFHDGMRACVQPDDGLCSDGFEVEQRLRQKYELSPLLFYIFFAAVLSVVVKRFSEDIVHPCRAGAPEGTADVDRIGTGYGLRSSYSVGCAVRG